MTPIVENEQLRDLLVKRGREIERTRLQVDKLLRLVDELRARLASYEKAANIPPDPDPGSGGEAPEGAASPSTPAGSSDTAAATSSEREKRKKKKRKDAKKARKATRLSEATANMEHQEEACKAGSCPRCGCDELTDIGEEVREVVTLVPEKIIVRVIRRKTGRCRKCSYLVTAAPPADVLPNVTASPSLLARCVVDKYDFHLPEYRILRGLDRLGLRVHESTLGGWMAWPASQLTPLLPVLKALIFADGLMHFDGTGHDVLRKGGNYLGQISSYGNSVGIIYDFSENKNKEHVEKFLGYGTEWMYRGRLVCDADPRLDRYFKEGCATECGCTAHGRRYFEEAESNDPKMAGEALSYWGQLSLWEQRAEDRGLAGEALLDWRQKYQAPIAKEFHAWLCSHRGLYLPKERMAIAIMYCLRHWVALTQFLTDPRVPMDNNFAERSLRKVVVGRKNYLFVGSIAAGHRAATYYTFIETCRLHGVDPEVWLTDVLPRIANTRKSELKELLPQAWKVRRAMAEDIANAA